MTGPRLTVFLGAGGVGKTTLAAGYAVALAREGRRVGLLGIDPSRRLQSALGLTLADREGPIPGVPGCRAAILAPAECLRRWTAQTCDEVDRARLFANPFFVALADRLATAADVVAAVRLAEWAEDDPTLSEIVVDTAPGINAIELFRRPRHLAAFLEGDLVAFFRRAARMGRGGGRTSAWSGGARLALTGLGRLAGLGLLRDFGDFLEGIEMPVTRMLERITAARRLTEESADVLLVTTVRDDAATAAATTARTLASIGVSPAATILNCAVPPGLDGELAALDLTTLGRGEAAVVRYARAYAATQARVLDAVAPLAPALVVVPATSGLDEEARLDALAGLGESLRRQLVTDRRSGSRAASR